MRSNNDETVNWMAEIVKKMAEVDSIALWSDDTLCTMTGSQPPVTQKDIMSTTATDKVLTMLKTNIEKGFPKTKAELQPYIQPYWRVKVMRDLHGGQGGRARGAQEQSTGYTTCSTPGDNINEAEGREEPFLAEHGQGHCQQAHVLHLM